MIIGHPALAQLEREVTALRLRITRLEHRYGVRRGAPLRLVKGGRA